VRLSHVWSAQSSLQGIPEFLREVTVLGIYRHPHLVPFLSFSLSRLNDQQEACLVYPLMVRGGLDQALADRTLAAHPLDAAARLRIAVDTAAGLAYLHAPGAGLAPMLHSDVKSSNVLLDEGLRARVADVGLARPQSWVAMTVGVGYMLARLEGGCLQWRLVCRSAMSGRPSQTPSGTIEWRESD
jgi:serine/threonine protein kinase